MAKKLSTPNFEFRNSKSEVPGIDRLLTTTVKEHPRKGVKNLVREHKRTLNPKKISMDSRRKIDSFSPKKQEERIPVKSVEIYWLEGTGYAEKVGIKPPVIFRGKDSIKRANGFLYWYHKLTRGDIEVRVTINWEDGRTFKKIFKADRDIFYTLRIDKYLIRRGISRKYDFNEGVIEYKNKEAEEQIKKILRKDRRLSRVSFYRDLRKSKDRKRKLIKNKKSFYLNQQVIDKKRYVGKWLKLENGVTGNLRKLT